jgi:iron complex outermembrane receptor protein
MRFERVRRRMRGLALVMAVVSCAAASLAAQQAAPADTGRTVLDRRVTLHLQNVSLREALDHLTAAAHIRLSYAADLLPLDRAVRTSTDTGTVGRILGELLAGTRLTPVATGRDQVVLAPTARTGTVAVRSVVASSPTRPPATTALDRVVVTGTPAGGARRPLTVSLAVVPGASLGRAGVGTVAAALSSAVPGMWVWEQSPATVYTRYASIRGASSFGAIYPKIYVDGISVANALVLTQMEPEQIERIEVIRGPQGAALYGADAISGVVNVITRYDGAAGAAGRLTVRSAAGMTTSDFAKPRLNQDYHVAFGAGSGIRSMQGAVGVTTMGAFYPGADNRQFRVNLSGRTVGARSVITGSLRLATSEVGATVNPLLGDTNTVVSGDTVTHGNSAAAPQSLTAYTAGVSARVSVGEQWTHTLVAGLDGYRVINVTNELTPFPSATDSALRAAKSSADRATIRWTGTLRAIDRPDFATTLAFAAEQSTLRQVSPTIQLSRIREGTALPVTRTTATTATEWLNDAGLTTQVDVAVQRSVYLTGGLRLERNDGFVAVPRVSVLPMAGLAYVRDWGGTTMKVRGAVGRGIRPPRTAARETMLGGFRAQIPLTNLSPEVQSGIEGGVDLLFANTASLQLTYFDQLGSGLIQQVVVPDTTGTGGGAPARLLLEYQNVGAITNRGIEAQLAWRAGPVSFAGTFTTVRSRVRNIAAGYRGDLRQGDLVLEVPHKTVSATVVWTAGAGDLTVGATRAIDWTGYDRVALAEAYTRFDKRTTPLFGGALRSFWRDYPGVTHLRASYAHHLSPSVTWTVSGENLLGVQRGEPDNLTILPGLTLLAGVRVTRF